MASEINRLASETRGSARRDSAISSVDKGFEEATVLGSLNGRKIEQSKAG